MSTLKVTSPSVTHDRYGETPERIHIGRRFKNDTERLENLFEMFTKMTTKPKASARV